MVCRSSVIDISPAEGISSDFRETSRDRVLTDDELAAVLCGARQMPWRYGGIVEFLALTGQRREEVNQLKWHEIDEETQTWCIPAVRSKNGKAHIVHLSEPALVVIEGRPRNSEFISATSMGKHFQAFAKGKRKLDDLCDINGWRLQDLRRIVVSGMARLGVPPHVADKILNHLSGTISGVAAVYQRHEFLAERKNALERWGAHVAKLPKSNVEHSDYRRSPLCPRKLPRDSPTGAAAKGQERTCDTPPFPIVRLLVIAHNQFASA
ncbi:MAG: site-specific integrase [Xanthobacteraceae bacterium]